MASRDMDQEAFRQWMGPLLQQGRQVIAQTDEMMARHFGVPVEQIRAQQEQRAAQLGSAAGLAPDEIAYITRGMDLSRIPEAELRRLGLLK